MDKLDKDIILRRSATVGTKLLVDKINELIDELEALGNAKAKRKGKDKVAGSKTKA